MSETKRDVADRLTAAWEANERPAWRALEREMRERGVDVSDQTIANYHHGVGPEPQKMDVDLIVQLADYYGWSTESISLTAGTKASRMAPAFVRLIGTADTRWYPVESIPLPGFDLAA